ncbi:DUF4240 domain-containing protein [Psychroserpens mesophilus]|uniref:DUF4240 domain-containing protein n=1 Tax=Psychroserpens mesophilus TaxID=325473 RepID=UPI00058B27F3|nr:DUF4240 domain-containing protein [Psychroserpens mesophilus]
MSYGKFLDEVGQYYQERKKSNLSEQSWEQNRDDTRDKWIEQKRYSELIAFIHENWDSGQWDEFFEPLEKNLIENKLEKEFIKFWKGLLRIRVNDFWTYLKYYKESGNRYQNWTERISNQKTLIKDGIDRFKKGLSIFNNATEITKLNSILDNVNTLEKPRPKKTTDKRKIDEELFWQLIELNRKKSEDKIDFIENLSNQLEEFKPTEIKKFERTFLTKCQELNRWEIWALAYIARRGCGDDAFDYFKAWVISKGKKTFKDIKTLTIPNLKQHFDEDPQLEEMFYLSENVYENKTGELMSPVRVKKQKLSGKEWKEENLEKEFPEIWKIFEHKKTAPNTVYN